MPDNTIIVQRGGRIIGALGSLILLALIIALLLGGRYVYIKWKSNNPAGPSSSPGGLSPGPSEPSPSPSGSPSEPSPSPSGSPSGPSPSPSGRPSGPSPGPSPSASPSDLSPSPSGSPSGPSASPSSPSPPPSGPSPGPSGSSPSSSSPAGSPNVVDVITGKATNLDPQDRAAIDNYLQAIYPGFPLKNKEDRFVATFIMNLGMYWRTYHKNIDENILQRLGIENVRCGGYYYGRCNDPCNAFCNNLLNCPVSSRSPKVPDIMESKMVDFVMNSKDYPPKGADCCKPGTFGLTDQFGSLTWTDYESPELTLRRSHCPGGNVSKCILYDPWFWQTSDTFKAGLLPENVPRTGEHPFWLLVDGKDGAGKDADYTRLDQLNFMLEGPGFPQDSLVEVSRDKGSSGSASFIFYYVQSGSGIFCDIGHSLRALNKIHALSILISKLPKNFKSFQYYSKTKPLVPTRVIKALNTEHSFKDYPQIMLTEVMAHIFSSYDYTMNGLENDGGVQGRGESWPWSQNGRGWSLSLQQFTWKRAYAGIATSNGIESIKANMVWFFEKNGLKGKDYPADLDVLGGDTEWTPAWETWSQKQIETLGQFWTASWAGWQMDLEVGEAYALSKMSNTAAWDFAIWLLAAPTTGTSVEINGDVAKNQAGANEASALLENGKAFEGVKFQDASNKEQKLDTVQFCLQPGGSNKCCFELIDLRYVLQAASLKKWQLYASMFLRSGVPTDKNTMDVCTLKLCDKSTEAVRKSTCCITSWFPGEDQSFNWKSMACDNVTKA
jgi:hypothetical protein